MSIRSNKEEVVKALNERGFILIKEYTRKHEPIHIMDKDGYKYKCLYFNLINKGGEPLKVHIKNPYSIENIKLFIKLNNKNIELLEENEYVNKGHKMKCRCSCGKIFYTSWSSMYKNEKVRCEECLFKDKIILNQNEVEEEIKQYGFELISNYTGIHNNLTLIDKDGYKYFTNLLTLRTGSTRKFVNSNPYTIDNIQLFLKINDINIELVSTEYVDSMKPLKWKCFCGSVFTATWNEIIKRKRRYCVDCSKRNQGMNRWTKLEEAQKFLSENGYILIGEYRGATKQICIQDEQGYKYVTTLSHLKYSNALRYSKSNPFTVDNMKNFIKLNKINAKVISDKQYDSDDKFEFECECGKHFSTTWQRFSNLGKRRCDKCTKVMSNLEYKVKTYLEENDFEFIYQYGFDDLRYKHKLKFDFAIFNNGKLLYLIEVQGRQHYRVINFGNKDKYYVDVDSEEEYKQVKIRDNLKREYCKNNNIPLLELHYELFKNNSKKYIDELNLFDLANRV